MDTMLVMILQFRWMGAAMDAKKRTYATYKQLCGHRPPNHSLGVTERERC